MRRIPPLGVGSTVGRWLTWMYKTHNSGRAVRGDEQIRSGARECDVAEGGYMDEGVSVADSGEAKGSWTPAPGHLDDWRGRVELPCFGFPLSLLLWLPWIYRDLDLI